MMKSDHNIAEGVRFPTRTLITAAPAYINREFRRLERLSPMLSGGIEAMQIDHRPTGPNDPVPNLVSQGYEEYIALHQGLTVQIVDGTIARDWLITARTAQDCVRLRIPFDGKATYSLPQANIHDERHLCTFIVQPRGTSLTGTYQNGMHYRFCALEITRDYLESSLGLGPDDLPPMLHRLWRNGEASFGYIPLERRVQRLASRLFSLDRREGWRIVQAQAVALELSRQLFDTWMTTAQRRMSAQRLKPDEHDVLLRLAQEAERRCPEAIPLTEAVTFTGMNRNKLQFMFRRVFGMSLQQYAVDLRMRRALALLQDSDLSISAIAEQAGFSEPTNFTAAFKKHFSALPSALRRGG